MSIDGDDDEMHPERRDFTGERPRAQRKDYDRLVKAAWDAGWWCYRKKNNYIVCKPPGGGKWVTVPSTPSKQGTLNITTRKFRNSGLDV